MSDVSVPKKRASVTCAEAYNYYRTHCTIKEWEKCNFCKLFDVSDMERYSDTELRQESLTDQDIEILRFMYSINTVDDKDKQKLIELRSKAYTLRFMKIIATSPILQYST